MKVPFLDLLKGYRELKPEFDEAYRRVMESGWYLLGKELNAFEVEFARYVGAPHCVAVGNGLDALTLALRAAGIGRGDEVVVPAFTFIATWLAVSQSGAIPVPADVEARTANLDPDAFQAAITPRTRAVIPVHLYGRPADMERINTIAARHGLFVLEDAAQAHGAASAGGKCGSLGNAAAFSFYPGKNLGAFSDGGAVVTRDHRLAEDIRKLRNYGSTRRYYHEVEGVNSRLDELQAAFLRIKLNHLNEWNRRRDRAASAYLERLAEVDGLELPPVDEGFQTVWHLFVVRHAQRDKLQQLLDERSIQTLIHYPVPPHLSGAYRHLNHGPGAFPVAERLAQTVLSLPMGPHLSDEEMASVCDACASAASDIGSNPSHSSPSSF